MSEFNQAHNPVYTFVFANADGSASVVASADPGRALVTGKSADALPATFKIPTLWGVARTAPYFHDNSAKTLEDVGVHYQRFFLAGSVLFNRPDLVMSDQERDDMLAYLRLL